MLIRKKETLIPRGALERSERLVALGVHVGDVILHKEPRRALGSDPRAPREIAVTKVLRAEPEVPEMIT